MLTFESRFRLVARVGVLGCGLLAGFSGCGGDDDDSATTSGTSSDGGRAANGGGKTGAGASGRAVGGTTGVTSSASAGAGRGGRGGAAGRGGAGGSARDEDAGVGDEKAGSGGAATGGKGGAGGAAAGGKGGSEAAGGTSADEAGAGGVDGADGAGGAGGETGAAGSGGEGGEAGGGGGDAPVAECRTDQAPSIPSLKIETLVSSGSLATLAFAIQPPSSNDWYLVEQRGRILILRDGQLLDTPFLDLTNEISLGAGFDQTTITYDERGLVSLAFAPDYGDSGLFYVAITPSAPDSLIGGSGGLQQNHDQVLEYRRSGDNPDRADTNVVRSLFDVGSSLSTLGNIHNINTVRFGPDGMLWVGSGDGGGVNCNDAEPGAAQDISQPFGKILRLDLGREAPYGAADNPFTDGSGLDIIMHYGVRNPFRFNFDRATGDLYFGDVGQSTYEEINIAPAASKGLNFGWATFEAEAGCPGPYRPLRGGSTQTPPVFAANRAGSGPFRDYRAIVGGVVYHGSAIPGLQNTYVFGDYYGSRLGALQHCGDATSDVTGIRKNCDPNFPEPCLRGDGGPQLRELTAIVEDHDGEIYLVANGNSLLKVLPGE